MSDHAGESPTSVLSGAEMDAVREIGSILMGAAATAISEMVNQRVDVSVPSLREVSWDELGKLYPYPCFLVQVGFRQGFTGEGQLVLSEPDARRLAQLLLEQFAGASEADLATSTSRDSEPLSEMETSALAEAMNQMMGASATALSTMLRQRVTLVPPRCSRVEEGKLVDTIQATLGEAAGNEVLVVLCRFRLQKGPGFDMGLLLSRALGRAMVTDLLPTPEERAPAVPAPQGETAVVAAAASPGAKPESVASGKERPNPASSTPVGGSAEGSRGPLKPGGARLAEERAKKGSLRPREITKAKRARQVTGGGRKGKAGAGRPERISPVPRAELGNLSIGLIRSVPVELEVRIGSVALPLHSVVHLNVGGIVTFTQSAREPVEVLANGRLVAYGQVVEVDGNYAVRITQLATSQERLAALRHRG